MRGSICILNRIISAVPGETKYPGLVLDSTESSYIKEIYLYIICFSLYYIKFKHLTLDML